MKPYSRSMTERIFKRTERDFWLYPKLLLVAAGGVIVTVILNRWLSDSSALILGFIPLLVLFGFMGRPVTYRQWFTRIAVALLYLVALLTLLSFARTHIRITWSLPTAVLGIIGGSLLFGLSLTRRWVNWCNDKPFFVPYFILFISLWAAMGGAFYLLTLLIGN